MTRWAALLGFALASQAGAQVQPTSRAQGFVLEVAAQSQAQYVLEDRDRERSASRADLPDQWLARDKAMHLGASFLLTLSGQYILTDKTGLEDGDALPPSMAAALGLGLLKEVADSQREVYPHFCWRDLAADAAGVALAAAVIAL